MKNLILSLTLTAIAVTNVQAQVTIDIDAQQRGPKISPTHYGIFFEAKIGRASCRERV